MHGSWQLPEVAGTATHKCIIKVRDLNQTLKDNSSQEVVS
jgi:hypothetical protein